MKPKGPISHWKPLDFRRPLFIVAAMPMEARKTKRTVEVSIMGQKFLVRSDSDEDYVERVADFVNAKVAEITSKSKTIPSLNVVILAAMNIADEFIRSRDNKADAIAGIEQKLKGMIELIDLQL